MQKICAKIQIFSRFSLLLHHVFTYNGFIMLSKNKIKFINSLQLKKNRDGHSMFIAEGTKLVTELLPVFKCHSLIATHDWLNEHIIPQNADISEIIEVPSTDDIKKVSMLATPSKVLATFYQPNFDIPLSYLEPTSLMLALDTVQDPGNLGTIIRIADWFGISDIFCSRETADVYNPKTVQATMGAIARVRIHYSDLTDLIRSCKDKNIPVYGTFLNGNNIYASKLSKSGLIVMGNEGKGISPEISALISDRLLIPSYPTGTPTSESLNVSVATAIICSEFRRRML